jgi:hypothetical protein
MNQQHSSMDTKEYLFPRKKKEEFLHYLRSSPFFKEESATDLVEKYLFMVFFLTINEFSMYLLHHAITN